MNRDSSKGEFKLYQLYRMSTSNQEWPWEVMAIVSEDPEGGPLAGTLIHKLAAFKNSEDAKLFIFSIGTDG